MSVDISGSMEGTLVNGISGFSAWMAAAGLLSILVNTEPNTTAMVFDGSAKLFDAKGRRVDDIISAIEHMRHGSTDIAAPVKLADELDLEIDCFVTVTDSETWSGEAHAVTRLADYRKKVGHRVKLINVQVEATDITNNAPDDGDMIEVAGFSANVPALIAKFAEF